MSATYKHNLKTLTWNVEGLFKDNLCKLDIPEIRNLINSFDVICLLETWCNFHFTVSGFRTYVSSRSKKHKNAKRDSGGVAILVKNEIKGHFKEMLSPNDDTIWLKLNRSSFQMDRDLFICCSYLIPENSSIFSWRDIDVCKLLEKDIEKYSAYGNVLLCGDLNSRTNDLKDYITNDVRDIHSNLPSDYLPDLEIKERNNLDKHVNNYGKFLIELCISSQLAILNGRCIGDLSGKFTCHKENGQSTVDYHIVSKCLFKSIQYFRVHDLSMWSDHCPVSSSIQLGKLVQNTKPKIKMCKAPSVFVWDENSEENFKISLNVQKHLIDNFMVRQYGHTSTDSDQIAGDFNELINELAKPALKRRKVKTTKKKPVLGYNKSCEEVREHLLYIKTLVERYPTNRDIKRSYYQTRKIFYKKLKQTESAFKKSVLLKLSHMKDSSPTEYWKLLKTLQKQKNDNADAISADTWYSHFKGLLQVPNIESTKYSDLLRQAENAASATGVLDNIVTRSEVLDVIKCLKNNKSAGPDGIINEIFKCGRFVLADPLVKLLNVIFDSQHFPTVWKQGILLKLFKSGDPHNTDNYRGIILNSIAGKFLSLLMTKRLQKKLENDNILHKLQGGFRQDHRTSDNIFILSQIMKWYKSKKKALYICFIDFRKAFDKLNRNALLYKLINTGISGKFYNLVKSMYSHNKTCVKVDNQITEYFDCNIGVRQGDPMSPTLFNIFINDLAASLEQGPCDNARIENFECGFMFYADDLVLLSQTKDGLQRSIDIVSKYCQDWSISINAKKSKVMVCNKKLSVKDKFVVVNETLEIVKKYNYLGVIISHTSSFNQAIETLTKKAMKCSFSIGKLLSAQYFTPIDVQLHCFDIMVKPVLLYCSEIWGQDLLHSTKEWKIDILDNNNDIEKMHVKFCKFLLHVHSKASNIAVRSELGRPTMICSVIASILRYYCRLKFMSDDRPVKQIYNATKNAKFSLFNIANKLLDVFDIDLNDYSFRTKNSFKKFNKELNEQIQTCFEEEWFTYVTSPIGKTGKGNKLRTYSTFKRTYDLEKYLLDVKDFRDRVSLTKLRISAHTLRIERGRYERCNGRVLPAEERICKYCHAHNVEDEYHFVMICDLYSIKRSRLLQFLDLSEQPTKETFVKLMSAKNAMIASQFSAFVNECFELRTSKTAN